MTSARLRHGDRFGAHGLIVHGKDGAAHPDLIGGGRKSGGARKGKQKGMSKAST